MTQPKECPVIPLDYQQEDGMVPSLPLGINRIEIQRIMTTSALAVMIPFKTMEWADQSPEALYCGYNSLSHNMITVDRKHETEQITETVWQHGGHAAESWKHHQAKTAAKKEAASNPISRGQQKWSLKRQYINSRRAGNPLGNLRGQAIGQGVEKARNTAENIVRHVGTNKRIVPLLVLGGLLIFVMYSISACSPMIEAALSVFTMGTYPAEEADVRSAEAIYARMEQDLRDEINYPERYYPDCDEYIVDAQEIWHDPYALISLISAYLNGEEWTADTAMPVIEMLFHWQYEKEVRITTEQRYHTETVNGKETKVWHDVTICAITLKNKNLSHAPIYIMDESRVGMYALYMSTLGNIPDVFAGWPHASALKEPSRAKPA